MGTFFILIGLLFMVGAIVCTYCYVSLSKNFTYTKMRESTKDVSIYNDENLTLNSRKKLLKSKMYQTIIRDIGNEESNTLTQYQMEFENTLELAKKRVRNQK